MSNIQTTEIYNARHIVTVAANTTLTTANDHVKVNGAYTITLPVISTLASNLAGQKRYKIENAGTSTVTIAPGSGNTINSTTAYYLYANGDYVIISVDANRTNWIIEYPDPIVSNVSVSDDSIKGKKMLMGKHYGAVAVTTSGTTSVNVFGAAGAPCALTITGVMAVAKDTVAGNISVTNGTNAVVSFAKSTTAGIVTGEDGTIDNSSVAAGATLTVESSSTGNAHVWIAFTVA